MDLAIPSAVSLLEAQIDRKKACGQRFPVKPSGAPGHGATADMFRSARCAPNDQVRQSVKAHPSTTRRPDPPPEIAVQHDISPSKRSPSKRSPTHATGGAFMGQEMDGEVLPKASSLSMSQIAAGGRGADNHQYRINVPQRIEPPKDLNTPVRIEGAAPKSFTDDSAGGGGDAAGGGDAEAAAPSPSTMTKSLGSLAVNKKQASVTKMKDQEMLAFACRRANKGRNEGLAYYNMGVLNDNEGEYHKAIRCYERFLEAARAAADAKGEQLALNSIAVDYHKLGLYERAIEVDSQLLQAAGSDIPCKFVAHCNLGLSFGAQGEYEKASLNHRHALRYAIVMSSLVGESVACGNLGLVSVRRGDAKTARACMERHLKLAAALGDRQAQLDAAQHLGQLANDAGEYAEAAALFGQARDLALDTGQGRLAAACKCRIGMCHGNAQLDQFVSAFAQTMADLDVPDPAAAAAATPAAPAAAGGGGGGGAGGGGGGGGLSME